MGVLERRRRRDISMSSAICNIGINHPAYKVSKREILEWFNAVLNANISNVDKDVGDGAAYAQVFHAINRSCVPLKQVKFMAKSEYEYTLNYNIVQKAMKKLDINKIIPCEALMKGKPLDNIEFCQWLKHYYSNVAVMEDYDGCAEREAVDSGVAKKSKRWAPSSGEVPPAAAKRPASRAAPAAKKAPAASKASGARATGGNDAALATAQAKIAEQVEEISSVQVTVDEITKERDFYFGKLRDVEIMIQEQEAQGAAENENVQELFESIKALLYATDDAAEEEDEELI